MEVQNFRPHDKGALKGFFDLKVPSWGNLIIRGMQLFTKEGRSWVNFPSKEFEVDGEKKWYALMRFEDKEVDKRFGAEVLKLLEGETAPSVKEVSSSKGSDEQLPF